MNVFLVTTYNIQYLRISLSSIARYEREHPDAQIMVVINNDSETSKVSEEYCRIVSGLNCEIFIRNTDKNKAHLGARIDALDFLFSISLNRDIKYFMFVDDDDVVLNPSFDSDKPVILHRAVVVHRLKEVLYLINTATVDLTNQFMEFEEWKAGCVGNPMKFSEFYSFIGVFKGFLPTLYTFYGSKRVMEPDDMFLMICFNLLMKHEKGPNMEELIFDRKDQFSYALTLIEERRGRYEVDPNAVDLRYGIWDGSTTYQKMYDELTGLFNNFLNEIGYE